METDNSPTNHRVVNHPRKSPGVALPAPTSPPEGRGARLRAAGGAAAPLRLWACMESDQGNADCLLWLLISAALDHARSHLAMGRVRAGRGPGSRP